jgi:hypothetical protein
MNLKDAIKDAATKWKATKEAQFVWTTKDGFTTCGPNEKPANSGHLYGKIDASGKFIMLDG